MAPYGRDRWVGLAAAPRGRRQVLEWWEGTTAGGARRGGTLSGEPWEAGDVAAGSGGAAVVAWTTMQPRRGAGSNLRPRVVLVARRAAAGRPFSAPRRVSPLPPPPPYGQGRGPALSATAVTVASGGGRTVAVAWHRRGRLEARISRDGGRTFGPVRRIGPCPEPFPRIALRVSADGEVLAVWGSRERTGERHALVYRMARSPRPRGASAPFSTELRPALLERTEPIVVPFPVADQYGPPAAAAFAGGSPVVAWQGVDAARVVVRVARPDAPGGGRQTLGSRDEPTSVLDDLLVQDGVSALAWHGAGPTGSPLAGHVALGPAGGSLGPDEPLPGEPGVLGLRLARVPGGVLAAWHGASSRSAGVVTSVRPTPSG
jgi:YD repeat-containing protein